MFAKILSVSAKIFHIYEMYRSPSVCPCHGHGLHANGWAASVNEEIFQGHGHMQMDGQPKKYSLESTQVESGSSQIPPQGTQFLETTLWSIRGTVSDRSNISDRFIFL